MVKVKHSDAGRWKHLEVPVVKGGQNPESGPHGGNRVNWSNIGAGGGGQCTPPALPLVPAVLKHRQSNKMFIFRWKNSRKTWIVATNVSRPWPDRKSYLFLYLLSTMCFAKVLFSNHREIKFCHKCTQEGFSNQNFSRISRLSAFDKHKIRFFCQQTRIPAGMVDGVGYC